MRKRQLTLNRITERKKGCKRKRERERESTEEPGETLHFKVRAAKLGFLF